MRLTPRAVSARELTRLMAGLTREEARRPRQRRPRRSSGETMHPQDYPRDRPAFRRDGGGGAGGGGGGGRGRGVQDEESHTGPRRVARTSRLRRRQSKQLSLTARRAPDDSRAHPLQPDAQVLPEPTPPSANTRSAISSSVLAAAATAGHAWRRVVVILTTAIRERLAHGVQRGVDGGLAPSAESAPASARAPRSPPPTASRPPVQAPPRLRSPAPRVRTRRTRGSTLARARARPRRVRDPPRATPRARCRPRRRSARSNPRSARGAVDGALSAGRRGK